MRRAARKDDNQREIERALIAVGCSVLDLSPVGQGCPDMLVGYRGRNMLMEVKRQKAKGQREGKLTETQERFFAKWRGPVFVVKNVDEALAAIGAKEWEE